VNGSNPTTGKLTAGILHAVDNWRAYPKGYSN